MVVLVDEVFNVGKSACPEIVVGHELDQLLGVDQGDLQRRPTGLALHAVQDGRVEGIGNLRVRNLFNRLIWILHFLYYFILT